MKLLPTLLIILIFWCLFIARSASGEQYRLGHWSPGRGNVYNATFWAWCGHRYRWCDAGAQAWRVAGCETGGTYNLWARNGQYLGLWQMGSFARARYGHAWDPWGQAVAAHRYWLEAGGWSPWTCRFAA